MFTFVIWCVGLYFIAQILDSLVEMFRRPSPQMKEKFRKLRDQRNERESIPLW
jgi:hypothetical protein